MSKASITGLGFYAPSKRVSNADLVNMGVDTNDEWIQERTGIQYRHLADDTESTSDMAVKAAEHAIQDAGISKSDIDLVLVATSTPDYLGFPSTACLVQSALGLRPVGAFDLVAACSGFTYGLSVASQYIQTGTYRCILLIGADTLSKWVNWQDRGTCILFGDGAGAAIIQPSPEGYGVLSEHITAMGEHSDILRIPGGGTRHAQPTDQLCKIEMEGRSVFKVAIKDVAPSIEAALKKSGITTDQVDWLVLHQANKRIIDALADHLGIPNSKVLVNIQEYGNTSAASIPIVLSEFSDQFKNGDVVVMCGFGAGFTIGTIVLRWWKK